MWKTNITKIGKMEMLVRGYKLSQLIESCSFADMVLLMSTGCMPHLNQSELMDAILVSCCDESLLPRSTNVTRFNASCGVPLEAALASGIIAFGGHEGGSVETCAGLLQAKAKVINKRGIDEIANEIVDEFDVKKEKIPGLGHSHFEADPRGRKIVRMTCEKLYPHPHTDLILAVEKRIIDERDPRITINISGGVAAAILDLGIDWRMAKGIVIIARSLGLVAHALEEIQSGKPYEQPQVKDIMFSEEEAKEFPLRISPS